MLDGRLAAADFGALRERPSDAEAVPVAGAAGTRLLAVAQQDAVDLAAGVDVVERAYEALGTGGTGEEVHNGVMAEEYEADPRALVESLDHLTREATAVSDIDAVGSF